MHVLLIPTGSHGDVHPFIGLGSALRDRGHRVTFLIDGYFEPLTLSLGFETVALSDAGQFLEVLQNPDLWHPRRSLKVVFSQVLRKTARMYQEIAGRYVPGETVAVGGSLSFGMRLAAEKLGIPAATLHLAPSVFYSSFETPVYRGAEFPSWLPRRWKAFFYDVVFKYLVGGQIDPIVNQARAEVDLPPIADTMRTWIHSPDLVIGAFPEWYGKPQPDWPPQTRLSGFPLYDERDVSPVSAELEGFLDAGTKPVAFTPGSANVHGRAFFEAAVDACLRLGCRGLLLTRHPEQVPSPLPETIRHEPFAPFSKLLPRVAALVHHGGIGTASQALLAGIPQLIMPLAHDQFDNADRLERLGVARSILPSKFQGKRVAKVLGDLLGSERAARCCLEAAGRFDGENAGLERAAILVESLGPTTHLHPKTKVTA